MARQGADYNELINDKPEEEETEEKNHKKVAVIQDFHSVYVLDMVFHFLKEQSHVMHGMH